MANNYQKQFHIFSSMDNDVGNPSGYLKVEINGELAKLQLSLNKLLSMRGKMYQLYGIIKDDKKLAYTVICDIQNVNGRADVKINTNVNQVGTKGLSLQDINIFAIIVKTQSKTPTLKCPLVAYTKGEVVWRSEFERSLLHEEINQISDNAINTKTNDNTKQQIAQSDTNRDLHIKETNSSTNISDENSSNVNNIAIEKQVEISQGVDSDNVIELFEDRDDKIESTYDNKTEILDGLEDKTEDINIYKNTDVSGNDITERTERNIIEEKIEIEENKSREIIDEQNNDTNEAIEIQETENKQDTQEIKDNQEIQDTRDNEIDNNSEKEILDSDDNRKVRGYPNSELLNDMKINFTGKFESVITGIYNNTNNSANRAVNKEYPPDTEDNDILSSVEENFKDISSIKIDKDNIRTELSIPDLKDELNKSFESYNPFKVKSKNFNWWKINSPGYLNNILFRHNIKTYLFFNPKVMLAHYKYRYIIFGIRKDRRTGKEYFICGVPGVYNIDENPFGSMGSWAQTEGYKPKYGAFGYWVIMIEPKTGKLMKAR